MRRIKKIGITFGLIFFGFFGHITGALEAEAGVLDFSFTYTSDDTLKFGVLGDTTIFESILENTGDSDSFAILMNVNSPTPPEWDVLLCSGGVCHGNTTDTVYVPAGEQDYIFVYIWTKDTPGKASITITVTSIGNPDLSESLTFHLIVRGGVPLTDRWGLLILISLIFASGLYLILKRLRPVRVT